MGLPLPNGKLAIWLFLVTEIMFFTGLIGTYIILRNGTPTGMNPWPDPHDVHLVEWMGAVNTFVLICSSLTVVLAHHALAKGNVKLATQYIAITLALGCVFLVIKAVEYQAKFSHEILPGRVYEKLDGPSGPRFTRHVKEQLEEIVKDPEHHGADAAAAGAWKTFLDDAKAINKKADAAKEALEKELAKEKQTRAAELAKVDDAKLTDDQKKAAQKKIAEAVAEAYVKAHREYEPKIENSNKQFAAEIENKRQKLVKDHPSIAAVADSWALLQQLPDLTPKKLNLEILGSKDKDRPDADNPHVKPCDLVPGYTVAKGLLQKHPNLHVSNAISFGNMWASCYFAMTGFHALHVLGGLVVFVIILVMAARRTLTRQHEGMLELTGLYWHFVDIVWIFLFPLLYLV
jgi:cytochrome c oxidase subunit 3